VADLIIATCAGLKQSLFLPSFLAFPAQKPLNVLGRID